MLDRFQNRNFHWQWFRGFFNITILRYLVIWFSIVPILSKSLSIKSGVHEIPIFGKLVFSIDLSLPFNWQLLWLASFFYVLALSLYLIFCPRFIRLYPSFSHYKSHGHTPKWVVAEALPMILNKRQRPDLHTKLSQLGLLSLDNHNNSMNTLKEKQDRYSVTYMYNKKERTFNFPTPDKSQEDIEYTERELFWEIFGRYSETNEVTRNFIIFLVGLAAILFSFTLFEHIYSGMEVISSLVVDKIK